MNFKYTVEDQDAFSFTIKREGLARSIAHVFLTRDHGTGKLRFDDARVTLPADRGSWGTVGGEIDVWVGWDAVLTAQETMNAIAAVAAKHITELNKS